MAVEFINAIATKPKNKPGELANGAIDFNYVRRYAQSLEDWGYDYTLVPYDSTTPDQFILSSTILSATRTLKTVVAVRPNTIYPTVAAQSLATLDQLGRGRSIIHIISGSADIEQRRQGDYLDKPSRYVRSREFIQVLRKAWVDRDSFSFAGEHYRFEDFGPGFPTFSGGALPISIGGSSDDAIAVGSREADIYSFWGEPLAETQSQIERVRSEAKPAGRENALRFWVTFQPIIADTDELAWLKAKRRVSELERIYAQIPNINNPRAVNVGTTRLKEIAAKAEIHDDNLWIPKAFAGAGGAASLLIGSPETVAAHIVKYVEIGADLISLPTLGDLGEAIDVGRRVLPLVRETLGE